MPRALTVTAVLGGLFLWTMVVAGLSFAMAETGAEQLWVIPLFGVLMAVAHAREAGLLE